MSSAPHLYHWEPNLHFLKPLIALYEKQVAFTAHWFDPLRFEQLATGFPRSLESDLQLEREGPLLVHESTIISSSFFMLEYIAEAFPGPDLLPGDAYSRYRARASAQFLGGLGADVAVLGCARYLAPSLEGQDPAQLRGRLAAIEPLERRNAWLAVISGAYDDAVLAKVRERLALPLQRVERTLDGSEWLAGSAYSIADIDAFALLRPLATLAPDLVNSDRTARIVTFLERMHARPAVQQALAVSRSGKPHEAFVPGAEPSRWG